MTTIEVMPNSPFAEIPEVMPQVIDAETVDEVITEMGEHWNPDYSLYRRPEEGLAVMKSKFNDIADLLRRNSPVSHEDIAKDLEVSIDTVDRFYEEWTSDKRLGDGTFAFMVPTRAERENGFAPEYKPFYPLINHIGPRLGQMMLVGTPPFVVDKYKADSHEGNGVMLFAPIFGDMLQDIKDGSELEATFNNAIEDAITFARDRLGVSSVGLGAILPAVTNFGRSINVDGVTTTTGHGGTIHLINEAISQATEQRVLDRDISKIGVIGLGSIGASVASVMASTYPDAKLILHDISPDKVSRTIDMLGLPEDRVEVASSSLAMLAVKDCNVVVCATTSPVNIDKSVYDSGSSSVNRIIVDDSQPTAVNPLQAKDNAGAHVVWPIGESADPRLHRESFDYADLGPIDKGVWGCEAEAFIAWQKPELALRKPVDPESALNIANAADAMGIGAAPLQCYGSYIEVQ